MILGLLSGAWDGAALATPPPTPGPQQTVPGFFMLSLFWGAGSGVVTPPDPDPDPNPVSGWVDVVDPGGVWVPVED